MPLDLWTAPNLARLPSVQHGFTHRTGGVSTPPFDSLNVGLHVGDAPDAVRENRTRVAGVFGSHLGRMTCAEQIHGGKVAVVSSIDAGRGAAVLTEAIPGVDALVTNDPGVLLALFFADCVPVFFADERHNVVAIAHAGWRGIVANVLENTLAMMHTQFGTLPADARIAIGPCIGSECFEVGEAVAVHFSDDTIAPAAPSGKPHVDLAAAVSRRLLLAGVLPTNLSESGECTTSDSERYFSHRRDRQRTGRMGGFIALRP
ncbi:MAG: peptidoglycan editing factor PgeF [Akkermansiaceae bacterium]|nr:peptidoglycan editing factor PgeF [Armatimonadota bacterium]